MHTTNGVSAASVCAAAVGAGAGDDESTGCGVMDVAVTEVAETEVAETEVAETEATEPDGAVTEVAELACLPESEHAAAISKHDVTIARRFISQ